MQYALKRTPPQQSLQEIFLRLAQMTTPHGHESYCWPCLPLTEHEHFIDEKGNVFIWLLTPDAKWSRVMWSCHLDSACQYPEVVTFRRTKKGKIMTDGKTILSADCKIGAAIMIKMIEAGIPGWYAFHAGEERGGIGSHFNANRKWPNEPDIAIAFDRKDRHDIITHQGGQRTCSDAFGLALAEVLNRNGLRYKLCTGGSFTDTKSYCGRISECTNISVGYFQQHCHSESQDMVHAESLLNVILQNPLAFEELPATRDPDKYEGLYASYHQYNKNEGGQAASGGEGKEAGKQTHGKNGSTPAKNGTDDHSPKENGSTPTTRHDHSDDESDYVKWWKEKGYAETNGVAPASVRALFCNTCKTTHKRDPDYGGTEQRCPVCSDPLLAMEVPLVDDPYKDAGIKIANYCRECHQETKDSLQCDHCHGYTIIKTTLKDGVLRNAYTGEIMTIKPVSSKPFPPEATKDESSKAISIVRDAKMSVLPLTDTGVHIPIMSDEKEAEMLARGMKNNEAFIASQVSGDPVVDLLKRGNTRIGKARKKVSNAYGRMDDHG